MAETVEVFEPGSKTPWTCGASAVTGGQVVYASAAGALGTGITSLGSVQATAGASALVVGQAAFDALPGQRVTVLRGGVLEVAAAGALSALTPVKSAANGRVTTFVPGTDPVDQYLGFILTAAASAGDLVWLFWTR